MEEYEEWNNKLAEIAGKALNLIFDEVDDSNFKIDSRLIVKKITKEMCKEMPKWIEKGYRTKKIEVVGLEELEYIDPFPRNPDTVKKNIKWIKENLGEKIDENQIIEEFEYGIIFGQNWESFMNDFDGFYTDWTLELFPTQLDYDRYQKNLINRIKKYNKIYVTQMDMEEELNLKIPLTDIDKYLKGHVSKIEIEKSRGIGVVEDKQSEEDREKKIEQFRKATR